MRKYGPIPGGYYMFTSLSARDKKRYLAELPLMVDLECHFTGEW